MYEDPVQPTVESVDIAQLRELPPAPNECLLDCVFGERGVTEDEPGDREQAVDFGRGQPTEGLTIAVARLFDEFRPHADRRARAGRSTGLLPYDRGQAPDGSISTVDLSRSLGGPGVGHRVLDSLQVEL